MKKIAISTSIFSATVILLLSLSDFFVNVKKESNLLIGNGLSVLAIIVIIVYLVYISRNRYFKEEEVAEERKTDN